MNNYILLAPHDIEVGTAVSRAAGACVYISVDTDRCTSTAADMHTASLVARSTRAPAVAG